MFEVIGVTSAFAIVGAGLYCLAMAYDQYTVTRHQLVTGLRSKRRARR